MSMLTTLCCSFFEYCNGNVVVLSSLCEHIYPHKALLLFLGHFITSIVVKCGGLSSLCEHIHAHKAVLLFLGHFIISIVVEMWWFEFIM